MTKESSTVGPPLLTPVHRYAVGFALPRAMWQQLLQPVVRNALALVAARLQGTTTDLAGRCARMQRQAHRSSRLVRARPVWQRPHGPDPSGTRSRQRILSFCSLSACGRPLSWCLRLTSSRLGTRSASSAMSIEAAAALHGVYAKRSHELAKSSNNLGKSLGCTEAILWLATSGRRNAWLGSIGSICRGRCSWVASAWTRGRQHNPGNLHSPGSND